MPNGKRRNRRRRKKKSALSKFTKSGSPIPYAMHTKITYVDDLNIDAPAAVATHVFYNANGIYDPQYAVGGHQPMGYDELSTFYDHAYVYAAKCTCTFSIDSQISATGRAICGIRLADNANTVASIPQLRENADSVWKNLNVDRDITITKWFFWPRMFKRTYKNADNQNTLASNPVEDAIFDIWVGSINATQDPANVVVNLKIDYYTTFTERKTLAQS